MSIRISSLTLRGSTRLEENRLPQFRAVPESPVCNDSELMEPERHNYGYQVGRRVLPYRMQDVFAGVHSVGRVGGVEFMVLLHSAPDRDELERQSGRLIDEISSIQWKNRLVGTNCSIGIVRAGQGGTTYGALYREADRSLYEAKKQGKGCWNIKEI